MRWITHTSLAVACGAALSLSPAALVGVTLGSVLPDRIDMLVAGRNKSVFQRIHRETSHWAGWYLLLIIGAQLFDGHLEGVRNAFDLARWGIPVNLPVAEALSGVGLGALSHVLLDALNPSGVPLSPLGGKPRVALNLVSTGTWKEFVFLATSLLVLGGLHISELEQLARRFF